MTETNKQPTTEAGRSMVEMLGTLAIIGVLSIGGIAGYTYAMEKHYTNEILNAASQRAIVIASQIAVGGHASLKEFEGQEVAGGTFDGTVEEWPDKFGIKVSGVKESVCRKLLESTENRDIVLAKTDGSKLTEADCSVGSFLVIYKNDMGKSEQPELDENGCYEVSYKGGRCCDVDKTVKVCPGDDEPDTSCTPNPPDGCSCEGNEGKDGTAWFCEEGEWKCSTGSDKEFCCSSGYGWNGTTCVDCGHYFYVGTGGTPETACSCMSSGKKPDGSCCDIDMGWNGTTCVSCWGLSGAYPPGVGGTPETACTCKNKAADGSCINCSSGYGWNGTTCVDCGDGSVGEGGTPETACSCLGGRKTDGSCCYADTGWNGTTCVSCWGSEGPYSPGAGGTPETACTCERKAADGSCINCSSGYGWNGTTCVDCADGSVGEGGSIATACNCLSFKTPDGSCCESRYGWNGTTCVNCGYDFYVGTGGTPETACNCGAYSGKKPDGSCCDIDTGWNGTTCVYCGLNPAGTGGSPETACTCREDQERKSDGSCW